MSSTSGYSVPTIDNFKLVPIDEVMEWNLEDIIYYSTIVGTVISNKMNSVQENQANISNCDLLSMQTYSTMYYIDKEISANTNVIINYDIRYADNTQFNNEINSTIKYHEDSIKDINAKINVYDGLIDDIKYKLEDIAKNNDSTFIATAIHYSTLYVNYLILDNLYTTYEQSTTILSSIYESSILAENESRKYIQYCADIVLSTTIELSTIYDTGTSIQSTLTQYRIDEIKYTYAYASTTVGVSQLSTLYETASLFDTYNGLVSTHTDTNNKYQNALSNYNLALTNTTGLSGATAAGWSVLAQSFADKDTKIQEQITLTSNAILAQVNNSETEWILASETAVNIGTQSISSFKTYIDTADYNIKYYSSMVDNTSSTIQSSMDAFTLYNSYYVSTVTGSNIYMSSILTTISTYGNDQTGVDEYLATADVLQKEYDTLTSSFLGNIAYSTVMNDEITYANNDYIKYSTIYDKTNVKRMQLTKILLDVENSIYKNTMDMNIESTIIDVEKIRLREYEIEMATYTLNGSVQSFKQRELFVVAKQVEAQSYYDTCVLNQVKTNTSSQTVANINTSTVNLAYDNLVMIQQFLDTFDSVYKTYDRYMLDLLNLSTSVYIEKETYSTFASYKNLMFISPNDSTISTALVNSSNIYAKAILDTGQNIQNLTPSYSAVNIISNDFMQRYMNTFSIDEIKQTENKISSIWNEGLQMFNGDISTVTVNQWQSFVDLDNKIVKGVDTITIISTMAS
jgi:hypothetical protein